MSVEIYERLESSSCPRFARNSSEICELLKPVHFELTVDLVNESLQMEFSQISVLTDTGEKEEMQFSGHQSMSEYSHVFKLILVSMFIMEMIILLVTSIMILARTWRSSNKVRNNTKVFKRRSPNKSRELAEQSNQGIVVINGDTLSHGVYIGQYDVHINNKHCVNNTLQAPTPSNTWQSKTWKMLKMSSPKNQEGNFKS